jgi:hypothetical protein
MPVDHGGGFYGLVVALIIGLLVVAAVSAGVVGFINLVVSAHGGV